MGFRCRFLIAAAFLTQGLFAQSADQVLVVVNKQSAISKQIGAYYSKKRNIPAANLCTIDTAPNELIDRKVYDEEIEAPVAAFLKKSHLVEQILYIVTTDGVPLRVAGDKVGPMNTGASVDSELTLLYTHIHGGKTTIPGPLPNPFFQKRDTPFRHSLFPIYLVTRLASYSLDETKSLIDRALMARNTGKFVIDLRGDDEEAPAGNQWLRTAALLLPKDRVVLEQTATVAMNQKDVIGYASWGSNDREHRVRFLHFGWLPGSIMTEFVSTDARTFKRPPDSWQVGSWSDKLSTWYAGSVQTLTADYIHEGANAASGQVDEPFLSGCPRPEYILPAYYQGRTMAESYYMGIPSVSWMNVVIGDPLMRLK